MRKLTLGDLGGAEAGLDQDIATLGTECGGNSAGQSVNTSQESGATLNTELELLHMVSVTCINRLKLQLGSGDTYLVGEAKLLTKTGTDSVLGGSRGESRSSYPRAHCALHCELWRELKGRRRIYSVVQKAEERKRMEMQSSQTGMSSRKEELRWYGEGG